jgi:hypothetical protein
MESGKIIPHLFADLIARIVPGALAIYFITTALGLHATDFILDMLSGVPSLQDNALILVLIFVGLSYFVGHLLPAVGYTLEFCLAFFVPKSFAILETVVHPTAQSPYGPEIRNFLRQDRILRGLQPSTNLATRPLSRLLKIYERNPYITATYIMYDWLLLRHPEAGARAAKYSSEIIMLRSSAIAILAAMVLHLGVVGFSFVGLNLRFLLAATIITFLCMLALIRHLRGFQYLIIQEYYAARCEDDTLALQHTSSVNED